MFLCARHVTVISRDGASEYQNVRKAYVDNTKSNAFSSRDLVYMFYIRDRCATGPSIFLRGDVQDVWRVPAFGTLGKELGYLV